MDPKPNPPPGQQRGPNGREQGFPKWALWVMLGLVVAVLAVSSFASQPEGDKVNYSDFIAQVQEGRVESITFDNTNGRISGHYTDGTEFRTTSLGLELPEEDYAILKEHNVSVEPRTPESSFLASMLPILLPFALIILFLWWMQRRAAGQMGNVMSIGRSKAKTYTTERPSTTFEDVAGYEGVKQEIREVVDFLRSPQRYAAIGARIPKGVLLVGPPGTGKTLIARAVAGEAGVPFLSVTGSDFMEMFVGVGASRVRDLFQSARKMGRAIIFIDEIDSIGRKRGAGLGGGHDEREQTLNQMLAEMDGFEATEGVVIIAATNRPDVLDGALLRPGRFDRQVIVPLPEFTERLAILKTHCRHKRIGPDVNMDIVARGTPGMAGADLANLVNEAALFAVRQGDDMIRMIHFEEARDRVMIGQRRESVVMTDSEKEMTAYHEGGHALVAALLPNCDPVHKVTILPTGMALGVTMTLPGEEKHSWSQGYIEDRLAMIMGGRMSEELVYGEVTNGAADDLRKATEIARKMVREWGMSDRIGPMAWGSHGPVFLGEDMVQSREYSDDTARIIDEEIEKVLRNAENRTRQLLHDNRKALDGIAKSLLDKETIDGPEVYRCIQAARTNGQLPASHVPAPSTGS
ncbi:MAG: ATP-dependent zinc metalloprotease FtsH [Acidimicrobiia bacterium]|nr:ATP-dependent zinc metalloprotease FtsH [Acidimicrobiia bacterium]